MFRKNIARAAYPSMEGDEVDDAAPRDCPPGRRRGRPPTGNARQLLSLRLSPAVIDAWRNTGHGWQSRMVALLEGSAPVSPSEAILDLPPSRLTNDDWVRLYGEEFAEWMTLTPAERWRQSTQLWATWIALGGARNDELL
nr:BrnA antitoxin family protein [Gemmatimonadaceae bacterium]